MIYIPKLCFLKTCTHKMQRLINSILFRHSYIEILLSLHMVIKVKRSLALYFAKTY